MDRPTFKEVWHMARQEKRAIVATVMMADDRIATVRIGPRGGWKYAA